jgi:glycosyltransferase involved in cell wall biosynthesis
MSKITCLLIGNIKYDGRVKKEIQSLSNGGHDVSLILSNLDDNDNNDYHCKLIYLPRNNGGTFLKKLFRNSTYILRVNKAIKEVDPDYIHCNDLNTLVLTFLLPNKYRIVYDSHEIYPETRNSLISKVFFTLAERLLIYKTHKVIVPQIDRLNYIYFKYNLPISHYVLLENFPLKSVTPASNFWKRKYGIETTNKYVISYIGALTKEREIDIIIKSMSQVSEDVLLFIVGKIDSSYGEKLINIIHTLHLETNVFLFDRITNDEVLEAERSSNAGICIYNAKNLNSYFCASNKIYEYLNYNAKVITTNIAGVARVIQNGINGYLLEEVSQDSLAAAINSIKSNNNESKSNYYWENQESKLLDIYSL